MVTVTVTNKIAAPVASVFALFTDLDHCAGLVTGIKKIEMLTSGPFGLRTRWLETREVLGREVTEELEVTAFEMNHSYTVTDDAHGARVDTLFTFEPAGAGTEVNIVFSVAPQTFLTMLVSPLAWVAAGKVRKALEDEVLDYKEVAERAADRQGQGK
jgi:uncharacterized membrane protein